MVHLTGDRSTFVRWCAGGVPALFSLFVGLLLKFAVNTTGAQSAKCSSGMCERPLSTTSTESSAGDECYPQNATLVLSCNWWFRQNGRNYTARCGAGGVWMSDSGCRLDIFIIIACASAACVAIFILFFVIMCVIRRLSVKKRQRKRVSNALGMKKRRARPRSNDQNSLNGQAFTKGRKEQDAESFSDDFTDDEEEAATRPNRIIDSANERSVYQNQDFQGDSL